jgi:hypothetical protein
VLLAKGDPELKAQLLFQFYDLHEDNVVSYEELVKMVEQNSLSFTAIPNKTLSSCSMISLSTIVSPFGTRSSCSAPAQKKTKTNRNKLLNTRISRSPSP